MKYFLLLILFMRITGESGLRSTLVSISRPNPRPTGILRASDPCLNTSVYVQDKDYCTPSAYQLYIYLLLGKETSKLTLDRHKELIQRILQPCIETEAGKNISELTFLPKHKTGDFKFIPISSLSNFDLIDQVFSDYVRFLGRDDVQESIQGLSDIITEIKGFNNKTHQAVAYFITNTGTEEITKESPTYWTDLEAFQDQNSDEQLFTLIRYIFTKEGAVDASTRIIFERMKLRRNSGDVFDFASKEFLDDIAISDAYGLCVPLPPDKLPKFDRPHGMSPVAIVFTAIGGILFVLFIFLLIFCIFCRQFCYWPNLKGVDWTDPNLASVLQDRVNEETRRFRRLGQRYKNDSHYGKQPENGQVIPRDQRIEMDEWEVSSKDLQVFTEKLGSGAYAVVYKGHLRGTPPVAKVYPSMQLSYVLSNEANYVAVKTTHEYATVDEKKEFIQEIEFMKRLEYHPHILSLIGCSTNISYPLILTEICEYGDLLNLVRALAIGPKNEKSLLEFNDLVPIGWQISDALSFLASKNIIHRDVAARNILVTKSKMAKLSDFGLCRHSADLFYHSRGGKLPIKWMAPESIEFAQFSTKTDVWSFGVVLYEMYSFGKTPFHSIEQEKVLEHLKEGYRLEIPESTPKWIADLMASCWLEESAERPDFSSICQRFYTEMEQNSECYGYLHFSKNYYKVDPTGN